MKQVVLGSVSFAVAFLSVSAVVAASYDFEFTADKYANEDTLWAPQYFDLLIQNTGTNVDTIDLLVTTDAPPGWSGSLCIDGMCVGPSAFVYLGPGETENLSVLLFNRGQPEMGLGLITGSMRTGGIMKTEVFAAFITVPSILLVDDDAGASYETYMEAALDSAGYDAHVWDAHASGRPGAVRLASYREVLWTTADGDASYLTGDDEDDIMAFLDGGGNLFLSSMGFLSSRGAPTTFTTEYLHLSSWVDDLGGATMVGVPGSPIGDAMNLDLTGGPFSADGTDRPSIGFPAESYFTSAAGGTTGIGVDEVGHKLVFLSFPFECVPVGGADPDNQKTLMARVMDWFDPPEAAVDGGKLEQDIPVLRQNSPNPFTGSTCIAFSVPGGSHGLDLEIYGVDGRLIRSLVAGCSPGTAATVVWDGTDEAGEPVTSGVYFYRLSGARSPLKKMVLLEYLTGMPWLPKEHLGGGPGPPSYSHSYFPGWPRIWIRGVELRYSTVKSPLRWGRIRRDRSRAATKNRRVSSFLGSA